MNDAEFDLVHAAYSSDSDTIDFRLTGNYWMSSRNGDDSGAKITVPASSLEELLNRRPATTTFQLVADIRGSEAELIENRADLLRTSCVLIIVEFHQVIEHEPEHSESRLQRLGFERIDSRETVGIYSNSQLDGHHELG